MSKPNPHSPLELIKVTKPQAPLPESYGWDPQTNSFNWALVEANFNFVTMGRVVEGDAQFYMRPLPLSQLGYRPHPPAVALHDALWELHGLLQRTKHTTRTESEKQAVAGVETRIKEHRRQIWTGTFEPLVAPKARPYRSKYN